MLGLRYPTESAIRATLSPVVSSKRAAHSRRHWRRYAMGEIPNARTNRSLKDETLMSAAFAASRSVTALSRSDSRSLMLRSSDSIVLLRW